jgi:replicative DNA helicase
MEQALLGAIMVYPSVFSDCRDLDLAASEFFVQAHQIIFQAMSELSDSGRQVDLEQIVQRLEEKDELDAAGGLEYLSQLLDAAVSSTSAVNYIETIQEKAQLRKLILASEKINDAASSDDDLDSILDSAERAVMDVTRRRRGAEFESAKDVIDRIYDELDKLKNSNGVSGVKTGYNDLDRITNGFHAGDLIILAARPAMGKSALALNFASQVAALNDGAVAIFSLEMPSESLIKRLLCSEAELDGRKLASGRLNDEDMNALHDAGNILSERKIFIDDTSMIKVSQIFSKCRKLKSETKKLDLIVIDYLQLISGSGKSDSRQQEVSEISRNLKILAKEMECPVIALSQLSRKVEERTTHEPQLSDLRESGSIEQDADIVMFIYREQYYAKDEGEVTDTEVVDVSLKKHRNGETGTVKMVFQKSYSKFSSYAGDGAYAN